MAHWLSIGEGRLAAMKLYGWTLAGVLAWLRDCTEAWVLTAPDVRAGREGWGAGTLKRHGEANRTHSKENTTNVFRLAKLANCALRGGTFLSPFREVALALRCDLGHLGQR